MLVQATYKIAFKTPLYKVIQCEPAYQDTFVLLVLQEKDQDQCIIHVNQLQIIKKYRINDYINRFFMVNLQEFMVPLVNKDKIITVNLKNSQTHELDYQFAMSNYDNLQVYYFEETGLICLKQNSNASKQQLLLNYFSTPINQYSKPLLSYTFDEQEYDPIHLVQKGNNHSMVVWYKQKNDSYFDLYLSEVILGKQQAKGILSYKRIDLNYNNMKELVFRVDALWQISKNQLILIGIPSNNLRENIRLEDQTIYIVNIQEKSIRQGNFKMPVQGSMTGEIQFLADYAVIQTFQIDLKGQCRLMSYFLNYSQQMVQSIISCPFGIQGHTTALVSNQNKVVYVSFDSFDSQFVEIVTILPMQIRQMYMFMLLHIEDNFDEDLLQDALEILDCV